MDKDTFCEQIRLHEKAMYDLAFSLVRNDTDAADIILYYYEDLRIDEIAKITNTNAIVTKQHLSRARKKLREILKEDFAK